MKKLSLVFWIILILAAFLRLYQLGTVPISPDWDEAALGYNAYTLLQTGRDEYGTWLPASIRSFGDYKPPVYAYLTVPSVALFGLSVFAVRLPSAIIGILAVVGVYVLTQQLLLLSGKQSITKEFRDILEKYQQHIALGAMALLSISPWHLQFSRVAFEANIGVTIHIWAITVFLMSLNKRVLLPVSAFLFSLGMYAYHSERVFLPLIGIMLICLFRKELFEKKTLSYTLWSVAVVAVCLIPLVRIMTDDATVARLKGTSSFTDQVKMLNRSIQKLDEDQKNGNRLGVFFDNRRFVWVKTVLAGYLSHFSLQWLFLSGDNPRHHAPGMGLLYLWELPFLILGLAFALRYLDSRTAVLLVGWLLAAPVAASITTGLPHGVRTLTFLPTLQIFVSMGLLSTYIFLRKYSPILQKIGIMSVCICICYGLLYYFTMYYVHMDAEVSEDWQYGYKQVVDYTQTHKQAYTKVVVSTSLDQSYVFFLFYTAYNPSAYLSRGGTGGMYGGDVRVAFDAYEFRPIRWDNEVRNGSILYVGAPNEIPNANLKEFTYLNGKKSFSIADR
jgi:4-amino-4-deoxy-L-arabinose transferase-like glycosyltransferase